MKALTETGINIFYKDGDPSGISVSCSGDLSEIEDALFGDWAGRERFLYTPKPSPKDRFELIESAESSRFTIIDSKEIKRRFYK